MTQKSSKYLTIVATMILVVVSYLVLKEFKTILIPFFLAVIISFIFEPLYEWLKSKKVPGWAAIIIIIVIIMIISNIASIFIITSINAFAADFPKYEAKFQGLIMTLAQKLRLNDEEIRNINESLQMKKLLTEGSFTKTLTSVFSSVMGIFGDFILILFYTIFLITEMGSIRERVKKAFTEERAQKISDAITEVFTEVKKYIVGKTIINLLQGFMFGFILYLFGVDYYFMWGFLCFFSHYIPNIGSLISTILPGLIAFLQFDSIVTPVIIIILLIVVQNIIGNVLEPKYLGDHLDLSPLLLLFSLIFWGYVWGIAGMILSVPIMSMIKISLSKFESTKPIAIMMSYKSVKAGDSEKTIIEKIKNIFDKKRNKK